jgi:competence protein ComEA
MDRGPRPARTDERPVTDVRAESQPAAAGRRPVILAVLLTSLAWLVLAGGVLLAWRRPQPVAFQLQPPPATATPAPSPTPAPITVDVAGAVLRPGVYELPASARSADAITAAGGFAPSADQAALSLAQPLQDGDKLIVPEAGANRSASAAIVPEAPDVGASRGSVLDVAGVALININTASALELEALPAIGPVTAQAIVDYRTTHGNFRSVEEIVSVKGIGPATLEKIKLLITVGD